ncbi:hypothetical protein RJT34_11687 [Clitoria ternatea]|uniref:Trehalose-phosphatase n=1 Tax=Clitoria ternatea TaxID=43366 RepID=A0AAN9JMB5_CLITE
MTPLRIHGVEGKALHPVALSFKFEYHFFFSFVGYDLSFIRFDLILRRGDWMRSFLSPPLFAFDSLVVEIRPSIKWNKGNVLEYFPDTLGLSSCSDIFPVYIGDDRTDEDAFKVLLDSLRMGSIISFLFREAITDVEYKGRTKTQYFHAIGTGVHACLGNELAKLETLIMVHHLVTKFR